MKEFVGPILKQLNGDIESSGGVYLFGDVSECISEILTIPLCYLKWSERHCKYVLKLFMHLKTLGNQLERTVFKLKLCVFFSSLQCF